MYVISLHLEVNRSGSAIITVSNSLLISLLFYGFLLLLGQLFGFPASIHIWFCRGCLLVPHSIKYYTCSFTNLAAFEISLPSIFQHWSDSCSWTKKDNTHFWSMFCLVFILLVTSSLLFNLCEYLINVANARIQSSSQSNSSLTYPRGLQYFLISGSPSSLAASRSALLIAYIYLPAKSMGLDAWATSASTVMSAISLDSFSVSPAFSIPITSFIAIILIWHILCCQFCKFYLFLFVLL